MYIINSREIHSFDKTPDDSVIVSYVLQINYDFLKSYFQSIDSYKFKQPNAEIAALLADNLLEVYYLYKNKNVVNNIKINSLVLSMLSIMVEHLLVKKDELTIENITFAKEKTRKIVDYINNNYHNCINVNDIAAHFEMTNNALTRHFKQNPNINIKKYLTEIRLKHAYYDLIDTDYSIIDIAYKNGFANSKSFSSYFKDKYGYTPGQYRKIRRK